MRGPRFPSDERTQMKRWLPIVAAAFVIAGCDNSNEPPAPQVDAQSSSSGGSAGSEELATGPRGPEQTLPPVASSDAPSDSGRDSPATNPSEPMTEQEEKGAMPEAGQANNYMSEALKPDSGGGTSPQASSGAAPTGGSAPGGDAGTQLAQSGQAAGAAGGAQAVSQDEAQALMKKHNCSSCHAIDKKLVGPSYKEVAEKYKGDADAEQKLVDKVVKGGSGVWGPVPMPPHPTVPKEDIQAIVDWIVTGAG